MSSKLCVIRWPKATMVVDLGFEHGTEFGSNKGSRRKAGRSVFGISGNVMKGDSAKRETRLTTDLNITEIATRLRDEHRHIQNDDRNRKYRPIP